ncbi:winged helix-turn-helix domain-containing protein [Candidatus Hecatella orcuttiae]|jgi:DNA-binding HxlR family transcriptional regulator|uniref:winged helix-turn-helix domain-containing protein n=1 Tax=Candidatus Hecatella orcuttiae TaxID=1935119 RepID=UPI002867EBBB|nr:winged helix-turn-helix domain-containing protein [Candidatus Hecatella orcuttiae]
MSEEHFHPNAYLPRWRNKKAGVRARTLILYALDRRQLPLRDLRSETQLTSSALNYHLKLLEEHRLVRRVPAGRGKTVWTATGLGQQSIVS